MAHSKESEEFVDLMLQLPREKRDRMVLYMEYLLDCQNTGKPYMSGEEFFLMFENRDNNDCKIGEGLEI